MKTPYFLIHRNLLDNNIHAFQSALKSLWPNSRLAYSVKTNSLPWLLVFMHGKNLMAEVVSDEEYELALLSGYEDDEIVFNGPIKGEGTFIEAVRNGAVVNLDSKKELIYLSKYSVPGMKIGIRVNVPPELFNPEDIDYTSDGFRFGFSEENGDFENVLSVIRKSVVNPKLGLHLHCNSITRSVNVYRAIARYARYLVEKFNLELDYLDIGGGYFGGVPGKNEPRDYIVAVRDELNGSINPEKTQLIMEPGSAIIGSVVDLHTSVLDTKDTPKARIVTTDGSRIHIDPLWKKTRYTYVLDTKLQNIFPRQIICGYTCMDHDRMMVLENDKELSVGDEIIYTRVGAYTMTFGGMFIRYFPDVYVEDADGLVTLVRKRISVDDYIRINR